jgi:putative Mg2+ transporter-C (MgtC) family protein
LNIFFGIHIAPGSQASMIMPLVVAVMLGGLIGLERELHGHPAGLRTHILVCVGATLMTIVSAVAATGGTLHGDPTRISAQIVSGIGFLGAGAIVREGATVKGLTTAASIWATAGVGIALGAGPRLAQLAVATTAIMLVTLWLLDYVENWIELRLHRRELLEVTCKDTPESSAIVLNTVTRHGIVVKGIDYDKGKIEGVRHMLMRVHLPREFDRTEFLRDLGDESGVVGVDIHR